MREWRQAFSPTGSTWLPALSGSSSGLMGAPPTPDGVGLLCLVQPKNKRVYARAAALPAPSPDWTNKGVRLRLNQLAFYHFRSGPKISGVSRNRNLGLTEHGPSLRSSGNLSILG